MIERAARQLGRGQRRHAFGKSHHGDFGAAQVLDVAVVQGADTTGQRIRKTVRGEHAQHRAGKRGRHVRGDGFGALVDDGHGVDDAHHRGDDTDARQGIAGKVKDVSGVVDLASLGLDIHVDDGLKLVRFNTTVDEGLETIDNKS